MNSVRSYTYNSLCTSASNLCAHLIVLASNCLSSCSTLFPLGVTVRYEQEHYIVNEEAGYVTLALVLEGNAAIPVTVSVNTLDLLNRSVGDAATGGLMHAAEHIRGFAQCSL